MTTPISNDKILPSDNNRTTASEKGAAEKHESIQSVTSHSTPPTHDENAVESSSVDVKRATQIYSQEQTQINPEENNSISNPEQASLLATEIGKQIEESAVQAFKAQAGSVSMNMAALLETAPV